MNRRDLARYVRELGGGATIKLREAPISTSAGDFALAHALIMHEGRVVEGFGVEAAKEAALDKALWETVERYWFYFLRPGAENFEPFDRVRKLASRFTGRRHPVSLENLGAHSVGCAVHSSGRRAAAAAVSELIERHTILAAQLMSVPGRRLSAGRFIWRDKEVSTASYGWEGPLRTCVVLTEMVQVSDGRALFSCGAAGSLATAKAKAWVEALSLLENFEEPGDDRPDLEASRTIRDLMRWHRQNVGRKPFYRGGLETGSLPRIDAGLRSRDFWVTVKALQPGLFFARAYCAETQNLFVGYWKPSRVIPRLRCYLKEGMEPPYAY